MREKEVMYELFVIKPNGNVEFKKEHILIKV